MGFVASKIFNIVFVDIGNLVFLLLLLFALGGKSVRKRRREFSGKALGLFVFLLILPAFFPVDQWLIRPLENRALTEIPEKVDGIMMISGDERPSIAKARGEGGLGTVSGRYLKMTALARSFPKARLAFVGGTGFIGEDPALSTGAIAQRVFASLGVDTKRLLIEDQSRTTFENATFAEKIVAPKPEEHWLLITSALHMPRALATFRAQGWNVYPVPVDYRTLPSLNLAPELDFAGHLSGMASALHEYVGILTYWLQGKITSLWP